MNKRLHRTKHRGIILKLLSHDPIPVTTIHKMLVEGYEGGRLKTLPLVEQVYRTVRDLRQAGWIRSTRTRTTGCQSCWHYSKR